MVQDQAQTRSCSWNILGWSGFATFQVCQRKGTTIDAMFHYDPRLPPEGKCGDDAHQGLEALQGLIIL